MNKDCIETIGTISKEELLETVDYKILPNTLVLETTDPYPGYHHLTPDRSIPTSIFLVTRQTYEFDTIVRAFESIMRYSKIDFSASLANLEIGNDHYSAIRILKLGSYEHIALIQDYFRDEGFAFQKFRKIKAMGIIRIRKFFSLTVLREGYYQDNEDRTKIYFSLPKQLSWRLFENITQNVRNNWDKKDFDAALGTIFINRRIVDIVRIFQEDLNVENITPLIDRYYSEIRRAEQ